LGDAVIRMLTDHALRQSLAEQALVDISRFTWKTATDRLEATLSGSGPLKTVPK
jgi:glycosyltransferase involved in cell wall biosynthesis